MLSRMSFSILAILTLLAACDDTPQVMTRDTPGGVPVFAGEPAGAPAGELAGAPAGEPAGVQPPLGDPCENYVPAYSNGDPIDCTELTPEVRCSGGEDVENYPYRLSACAECYAANGQPGWANVSCPEVCDDGNDNFLQSVTLIRIRIQ